MLNNRALSLQYLKNLPFKLATTSFIYPDKIIPNVIKLGSFFDEIELLIFESKPFIIKDQNSIKIVDVMPSKQEIKELLDLSKQFNLTYNIHLPIDISLTDISKSVRISSIDTIKQLLELCEPLNPTTYTLHLDSGNITQNNKLQIWRENVKESLDILSSYLCDLSIISVETLDYPFEYVEDIVEYYKMSICIDAGHLIKYGHDNIEKLFEKHKIRVPIIHLHGVDFLSFKDHQALNKTPPYILAPTMNVLAQFRGVVSLELFNYENLCNSLKFLSNFFKAL